MNPKRRFFQIHLSTAVVLMLVAGVLVWANVRERANDKASYTEGSRSIVRTATNQHGWPYLYKGLVMVNWTVWSEPDIPNKELRKALRRRERWLTPQGLESEVTERLTYFSVQNIAFNSLTGFSFLLALWQLCEWRIRRRAARKANE